MTNPGKPDQRRALRILAEFWTDVWWGHTLGPSSHTSNLVDQALPGPTLERVAVRCYGPPSRWMTASRRHQGTASAEEPPVNLFGMTMGLRPLLACQLFRLRPHRDMRVWLEYRSTCLRSTQHQNTLKELPCLLTCRPKTTSWYAPLKVDEAD